MAFNPDFGQANEAISRAATAFMQDWVGRRNDKRSMEYLNRSGEMWNEKSEKDAALEVARMIKQNELSEQSRHSEWVNDVSKLPEGRAIMATIQKKQLMGEDATPEIERLKQLYDAIRPGIEGVMTDYDTSGKNIMSLMGLFENPLEAGVQAMRNRAGDADRELKWSELAWDRQKKGMEKVGDAAKGYLKKVADLRSFYMKIRSGDAVIFVNPKTGLTDEIDKSQLTPEQLAQMDDMLTQMARVESKFLKGDISENDVEWLDQGWDYSSKSIAMTNAKKKVESGEYENFDQAVEREWSLLQSKEGKTDREFRIGAPIEDALDEATGGQYTFAPETPIELKKILWETYEDVKAGLELDEGGKSVVSDADIWAMILEDEEVGEIARKYVRAKKGRKQEPVDSPDTPALEEEKTGGK